VEDLMLSLSGQPMDCGGTTESVFSIWRSTALALVLIVVAHLDGDSIGNGVAALSRDGWSPPNGLETARGRCSHGSTTSPPSLFGKTYSFSLWLRWEFRYG